MGRKVFDTDDETVEETLEALGLNFPEIALLYRISIERDDTLSTPGKCVLKSIQQAASKITFESAAESGGSALSNHAQLLGRTEANAHPISAITGLQEALNSAAAASASLIPAGTKMLFQQTNAPTGWVKDTTHNNKALRVVTGTAGSGGTNAFSTAFNSNRTTSSAGAHTHEITVNNHTLTSSQISSHNHGSAGAHTHTQRAASENASGTGPGIDHRNRTNHLNAGATASAGAHTHSSNGSSGAHNHGASSASAGAHTHTFNLNVQYVDLIIATKQ